jgi:quercetin dioxygenase-like cupin family protein
MDFRSPERVARTGYIRVELDNLPGRGTDDSRSGRLMMTDFFVDSRQCPRRTLFPGVEIRTAAAQHMMLSLVELQPGAVVEAHSHPHEQVGMVLEGRAHFFIGEDDKVLGPEEMYLIPGGVTHRVVALDEGAKAIDVFHPIREDYLSE